MLFNLLGSYLSAADMLKLNNIFWSPIFQLLRRSQTLNGFSHVLIVEI